MPLESELTEKQVLEDLDYTVEKLRERHPAWLEDSNEQVDAVEAAYNAERQQLLSDNKDGYSVLEEWRIISGMLHQLYDGHTRAFYVPETDYYIDNWTQLNDLGIPAEINGISTEDLQKEYLELFSY